MTDRRHPNFDFSFAPTPTRQKKTALEGSCFEKKPRCFRKFQPISGNRIWPKLLHVKTFHSSLCLGLYDHPLHRYNHEKNGGKTPQIYRGPQPLGLGPNKKTQVISNDHGIYDICVFMKHLEIHWSIAKISLVYNTTHYKQCFYDPLLTKKRFSNSKGYWKLWYGGILIDVALKKKHTLFEHLIQIRPTSGCEFDQNIIKHTKTLIWTYNQVSMHFRSKVLACTSERWQTDGYP